MVATPTQVSPPLLALRGAAKSFGGVRALRSVDFELHAGEVHALLGENGAGKSTLIKIITGAHQPDAGEVTVAGRTVTGLTPGLAQQLGIACIYQQPALFPDLSVEENIGLRLEPHHGWRRVNWAARRTRATHLLQQVGASLGPDAEARTLSMPEQQLVEIACAVGAGARIVVMDEPTASLTHREQQRLFTVVRELRANGVGVIYISHRLEEIFALADRVTVLRDGASVGTHDVAAMNESALIKLMVGREVAQLYPPAESAPGATVLTLRDLGCAASGVRGVSFEVRQGEIFGLAGLVGAGRTELARVLLVRPRRTPVKSCSTAGPWSSVPRATPSPTESATCRRIGGGTGSSSTCRSSKILPWPSTGRCFREPGYALAASEPSRRNSSGTSP